MAAQHPEATESRSAVTRCSINLLRRLSEEEKTKSVAAARFLSLEFIIAGLQPGGGGGVPAQGTAVTRPLSRYSDIAHWMETKAGERSARTALASICSPVVCASSGSAVSIFAWKRSHRGRATGPVPGCGLRLSPAQDTVIIPHV